MRAEPRFATARTWLLVALGLALLPFLAHLGSPFLSDDGAILRYVHAHAAGSDAFGPQFGMHAVRFWRPVVTLSWDLQESLWGASPWGFRALNLVAHLGGVAAAFGVARRLELSLRGAWIAALAVAWFPFAGGTVVWIAGRTDVFVTFLLLGGLWAALGPRPAWAALWMLVVAATKETGFILPAWVGLFAWARTGRLRAGVEAAWPVLAAALLGLGLRRLALGVWVGGYPHGAEANWLTFLWPAARAWLTVLGPALGALGVALVLGSVAGASRPRLVCAAIVAAIGAACPLLPLLRDGVLEPTNARLLAPSWAALALGLGATWARPATRLAAPRAVLVALLLGATLWASFRDARRWANAAERSGARIERLRRDVQAKSGLPFLVPNLPAHEEGAYLFAYGFADFFREPFPASPVGVWPDRPLFGFEDGRRVEPAVVEPLEVEVEGPLVLDARGLEPEGGSPTLAFEASPSAGARFEVVLFTPSGYQVASRFEGLVPAGATWRTDLRTLLLGRGPRFSIGEAWLQAVDLGAEEAYLELRLFEADGSARISRWLPVRWGADFPALVAREMGYDS